MGNSVWRFGVLGPLEVWRDGHPVVIRAAKQRVLLASLLLAANQVVPGGTLVERLWGATPPPGHRNTLQNYVMRLRRLLGPGPIHTCSDGYIVQVERDALDLNAFRGLVSEARASARTGDLTRTAGLLREAESLWRGPALADVPSDSLHREVVPVLAENRLRAVELRIGTDLSLGRHHDVVDELHELTLIHPLREPLWALRIVALQRCGREAEALACYQDVRQVLGEALGADPGAELRLLHQRMLATPRVTGR
ncbi:AfsR/SARP family transcriptional regulator [Lentzea sp. NPDC005914]|uniref:AfsR/SARP family transcriptional regulator n=1 Tax=Lentzea sp. NPDC005914 TaxID=3154572 RepID=UPI0033E461B7